MKQRKHAAIMFTDIVGYTVLMGSDEDQAFEVLAKNREIHTKLTNQYNGTLIKEMGDGMLISFNLASDAVRCAIEIQKACKEQSIPLKIGIHEGEMVFEDKDVLGDAVNVASRLESDTHEGCIYISGSVYRDIKNRSDINVKYVKDKRFKNVDEPIKVYQVLCDCDDEQQKVANNATRAKGLKSKRLYILLSGTVVLIITLILIWKFVPFNQSPVLEKSIAVLPFKYLSEDQSKDYLADGVWDAVIGHLTKIDSLIVRPRTSVEQYRDTDKTMRVIGRELGVSYLIEGSFLLIDQQVRLTIQLIDAKEDDHIFFKEYDRDYSDIMAVQSEVTQAIAKEIEVEISPETKMIIETDPTTDMMAYDYYKKGRDYQERTWDKDDLTWRQKLRKAEEMYENAVDIDSGFVLAWVGLAEVNTTMFFSQSELWFHPKYFKYSKEEYLKDIRPQIQKTKGYLGKAKALAPDMLEVKLAEASYYVFCQNDSKKAIQIREKLHTHYPNNEQIVRGIATALYRLDEYKKSLVYIRKALSLNSTDWSLWNRAANILQILRRYDEAVKYFNKGAQLDASREGFSDNLFDMYLDRRKINEAKQYLAEHQEMFNEDQLRRYNGELLWAEGNFERSIRELEKRPFDTTTVRKGFGRYHKLGKRYDHIGQKEKATENFQKAKDIFESLPDTLKNASVYAKYAFALAGLGMTTAALDTINQVIEVIGFWGESNVDFLDLQWEKTLTLAMSGDHDALFDQMIYMLDRYGGRVSIEEFKCNPSQVKCDPFWRQFNEMERFQEIINNPKYQEIPLEE